MPGAFPPPPLLGNLPPLTGSLPPPPPFARHGGSLPPPPPPSMPLLPIPSSVAQPSHAEGQPAQPLPLVNPDRVQALGLQNHS